MDGKQDHQVRIPDGNDDDDPVSPVFVEPLPIWKRCLPVTDGVDTFKIDRTVFLNNRYRNSVSKHYFPDNYVSTAKYTLLNFLPKNLLEQFSKAANFYFLLIAIVVSIPGVTPIEPYTSILPLVFVLSVTAIKEAMEDYERHKNDRETNETVVDVVTPEGALRKTLWQDIQVGDIVKVVDGAQFPADMVLLSSSEATGECTIQTANLDGETNLKSRIALQKTVEFNSPEKLCKLQTRVKCQAPTEDMFAFEGVWLDHKEQTPLNPVQLLLRGARLKETDFVFGVVVYTGIHTKLVLNSNNPRYKRSRVEQVMNKQMYWIFFLQFLLVSLCAALSGVWQHDDIHKHWYLREDNQDTSEVSAIVARNFFNFYVLFSVMVPISLYVSMELVKVAQSLLIWYDIRMYDPNLDARAVARTSNLNEELGQISYIFSDKTGTLTQNKMSFYKCSVGGKAYGKGVSQDTGGPLEMPKRKSTGSKRTIKLKGQEFEDDGSDSESGRESENHDPNANLPLHRRSTLTKRMLKEHTKFVDHRLEEDLYTNNGRAAQSLAVQDFFTCLAVCHTVVPIVEMVGGAETYDYRGTSVDEVALVVAANEFGYRLTRRTRDEVWIDTPWKKNQRYQVLENIEFTSDRKRMSSIVRGPDGKVVLYCKGADSAILARISERNDADVLARTKRHVEEFSTEGLRTLLLSKVELDENLYQQWHERYAAASKEIGNRNQKMEAVAEEIEKQLMIIGASAIEDALQEQVVDTLVSLRRAGIKVWMLTGDKQGTAVNIGKSAGLVDSKLTLRYLVGTNPQECHAELEQNLAALDTAQLKANDAARRESNGGDLETPSSAELKRREVGQDVDEDDEKKDSGVPEEQKDCALVIDGPTLTHTMHADNATLFFQVINHPKTSVVICSRMAPKQKALVVELVKNNLPVITLAVGDGANDVSMIQAAHVGVGIRGKEGLQAVNNSDYAIAQFRFLARLLLVHGRLSYKRNTKLILYSFYKSMVITFTQFYFSMFSVFAGQEIYDGILLNTFNLFFASLPILAVAVFDRDLNPDELLRHPELYTPAIYGSGFNYKVFWSWLTQGAVHAIFVFFFPWFATAHLGMWCQSMAAYTCLVVCVNLKLAVVTTTWTGWNHLFTWGSILLWFLFAMGLSSSSAVPFFPLLYDSIYHLFNDPGFWLSIFLVGWLCMMGDYIFQWYRRGSPNPTLKMRVQAARRLHKHSPQPDFGPGNELDEYDPDVNGCPRSCSFCGRTRTPAPNVM